MAQFKYDVVVFIAVICAAHAAVTVNIYGDDQLKSNDISSLDEDTAGTGLRGCNPSACDQLCRRLQFPGGVCVNGRCKCDNFRQDSDFLSNDIPSLDEDIAGTGLKGCNPSACDQLCRRLQFPGGVCVNGRCKCDNFRQESDQLESNYIPSLDKDTEGTELTDCNPSACDQLCRRLQFPGGVCVNGRCKCDNFRQDSDNQITAATVDACNANVCSEICHRLGFRYGVCIGDICRCSNMQINALALDEGEKENTDNSLQSNIETVHTNAALACDQLACTMGCTELGFPGGSCFLRKCRCNRRASNVEVKLRPLRVCNPVACNMMCLRLMHAGGWCRFDTCECF